MATHTETNPAEVEYLDDTVPLPLYSARELSLNFDLVDDMLNSMDAVDRAIDLDDLALRAGHVH
jgi:hypothetical protein